MILFRLISTILGILSLAGMLLAFLPLLGWLNWAVIPFATFSLIVSSISGSRSGKTMCIVAIIAAILRLKLGGGIL